jgi:hypothetical protein
MQNNFHFSFLIPSLENLVFSCYNFLMTPRRRMAAHKSFQSANGPEGRMTIEQTIDVPASRRISFNLPPDLPTGKAKVELTITPEIIPQEIPVKSLESLRGIDKGRDTMDAYFARKRADKAKEDAQFELTMSLLAV